MHREMMRMKDLLLRLEINPHFFFNALNAIYSELCRLPGGEVISDIVYRLSGLMRFVLEAGKADFILLADEVKQVQHLIGLMAFRKRYSPQIVFDLPDLPDHVVVPPLLLLTLVENMFKHGDLSSLHDPGRVRAFRRDGCLWMITANRITDRNDLPGTGTGLENLQERVALYPGASFRFYITDGTHFIAEICLPETGHE